MAHRLAVFTVLALVAAGPARAGAPDARKRIKVAVMEIRALGADKHLSDLLSEVALTEAGAVGGLDVIGRSDIESMLGFERQKQMLGCAEEASCLAEIGGSLGVQYVIVGSLGRIGALYRLDLKLVDATKGRVRGRTGETVEGREEKLIAAVQRAAHRLLDPIVMAGPGGQLPPPTVLAPAPSPAASEAEPAKEGRPTRRILGYAIGGAGVAALAGGLVAGLAANSAYLDEKKAAAAGDVPKFESLRDQAKSRALMADLLYGVGAAGVGVGAWLIFSGPPASASTPPVSVGLAPTPSGALVVLAGGF